MWAWWMLIASSTQMLRTSRSRRPRASTVAAPTISQVIVFSRRAA
jgi:hypothetical protein